MSNWFKAFGSAFSSRSSTPVESEHDSSRNHSPQLHNYSTIPMGQAFSSLPQDDSPPPADIIDNDPCTSCPDPCDTHRQLPFYLKIDNTTPLEGTMKPYGRHVVIATGKSDWADDITDEKGSLAAALIDVINKNRGDKKDKKNKKDKDSKGKDGKGKDGKSKDNKDNKDKDGKDEDSKDKDSKDKDSKDKDKREPVQKDDDNSKPAFAFPSMISASANGTPSVSPGTSTPNSGYGSGAETPLSSYSPAPIPTTIPPETTTTNNSEPLRILTTNSSLTNLISTQSQSHDILLFPDNLLIGNVTARNADLFYTTFLAHPAFVSLDQDQSDIPLPALPPDSPFVVRPNPYAHTVMICSHRKRDKRCGIVAPLLKDEFERILREKDVSEGEGGASVLMVSHIGGHKFAGNIIVYTAQGRRGVWYGRVQACHVRAIVERTIEQGKVLKELYRGCMDGSFRRKVGAEELAW